MRRVALYIATALISFTFSAGATRSLNVVGKAIVDAIPVDDAPCWETTMRVCGIDSQGRPFGHGGEERKFPKCP